MQSRAAEAARTSKTAVRIWAWALGVSSFLSPLALLGLYPKSAQADGNTGPVQSAAAKPKRPVIIVVTRKIIQRDPRPAVTYTPTYTPSYSSGGGGGGVTFAQAPAQAPAAVSCGSRGC